MFSTRFGLPVILTDHARLRMIERSIEADLLLGIIDTGELKSAGTNHYWLYKKVHGREDNLLCVAAVIDNTVVVKTVMH